MTTIEMMIALTIGSVIIGAIMALWSLGTKMHKASQSTIALQASLTMTEALFADLRQMGLDPGSSPYLVGPVGRAANAPGTSLSFFRVAFKPDQIALVPVRFHTVPSPGGNKYLARTERRNGQLETQVFRTCPVQSVEFATNTDSWGNDYLRASVRVLVDDLPPGTVTITPDRTVRQQVVVRVPVPDRFGDPAFAKANIVTKEGELLPP